MASYSEELTQGLRNLKLNEKYTDFTIFAGGKEFKCHRVILAAVSTYFDTMFDIGLMETDTGCASLDEMGLDEQTCEDLLEYIYTGRKDILTMENAPILLHAAHMTAIKSLHRTCKEYLRDHADKSNCARIWQIAQTHEDTQDLAEVARSLILKHFAEIARSEEKLDEIGNVENLIQILSSHNINVLDKSGLFCRVAFSWIVADFENRCQSLPKLCESLMQNGILVSDIADYAEGIQKFVHHPETKVYFENLKAHCIAFGVSSARFIPPSDDVLVVIGGNEGGNNCSVMAFSFPQKVWFSLKPLPLDPGYNFAICSQGLDLYVSGGSGPGPTRFGGFIGGGHMTFLQYNGYNNEWIQLPNLPSKRQYHAMYAIDNNIYIFGGTEDSKNTTNVVFKFTQQKWTTCKTRLYKAVRSAAHACIGKKVYLIGGFGPDGNQSNEIQCFNCEFDQSYRVHYTIPDFARLNSRAINHQRDIMLLCKNGKILKCSEKAETKQILTIPEFDRKGFGVSWFEDKLLICGGEVSFKPQKDMVLFDYNSQRVIRMQETMPVSLSNFCFTRSTVLRENLTTTCGTSMATV